MKTLLIALAALVASVSAHQEYDQTDKEVIKKTLQFPQGGSSRQIVIDNISGSLNIVGYDGNDIQLVVHRTTYGTTPERLKEGKEKVRLDIREEPGKVVLYVDAPWRCHDGHGTFRDDDHYGYDADFDFDVKVPYGSNIALSTVNKGEVSVENMSGDFEVSNVNGGIEMTGIAGAGLASTVNGKVEVQFKKNPEGRCGFRTSTGPSR